VSYDLDDIYDPEDDPEDTDLLDYVFTPFADRPDFIPGDHHNETFDQGELDTWWADVAKHGQARTF